jgi:hypothetical protein
MLCPITPAPITTISKPIFLILDRLPSCYIKPDYDILEANDYIAKSFKSKDGYFSLKKNL